jgi:deoxyribodipyrimidine photolyase-related protein
MQCLWEVIEATHRNAYAHHIQHLMITGNFALLTGIAPAQVEEWHLSVYADAFEWVEMPNYTRQGVACRRRLVRLEALCGLRRLR